MGLFDKIKKVFRGRSLSAKETAADKTITDREDGISAPEGHKVLAYQAPTDPGLDRTPGGLLIASLGTASDEPSSELDNLLRDVDKALLDLTEQSRIVNVNGPIALPDLYAPNQPPICLLHSPLQWVLHKDSVDTLVADPCRVQKLLRYFYKVSRMHDSMIQQAVYVVDDPSPASLKLTHLIRNLGLEVRQPENKIGTLHLEIHRPEGYILSVLSGPPYPSTDNSEDTYLRTVNQEKDRAESENDNEELQRLEKDEHDYLENLFQTVVVQTSSRPLFRAPRLSRMILTVEREKTDEALYLLLEELMQRENPLLYMVNPQNSAIELRSFGDVSRALPVYPDVRGLQWAAQDLGMSPDSFAMTGMPPRALFGMAEENEIALAVNAFRDRNWPVYFAIPSDMIRLLAQGVVPSPPFFVDAVDLSKKSEGD